VLRFSLLLPLAAFRSRVVAVQCRLRRSSAMLPHCRRIYATTVAVPVFAAAHCGTKFANRWRVSCLPPFTSATKWRIYANIAIVRQSFQLYIHRFSVFRSNSPSTAAAPPTTATITPVCCGKSPYFSLFPQLSSLPLHNGRIFAAQPAPTAENNRSYCTVLLSPPSHFQLQCGSLVFSLKFIRFER
jgi:hypothetical protein